MSYEYSPAEWAKLREDNTASLRDGVEELESRVGNQQFDKVWLFVKEVRELFKNKPLERESQSDLWKRFCAATETLDEIGKDNLEDVEKALHRLNDAHPLSHWDEAATSMNRLFGFDKIFGTDSGTNPMSENWTAVNEVSALLHEKTLMAPVERRRLRDEINQYRDKLREIEDLHRDRYRRDCDDNHRSCINALNNLENDIGDRSFSQQRKEVSTLLKESRPMNREQRDEVWDRFRNLCSQDIQAQIERMEERLSSQENYLDQKRAQREKLSDMLENARGDEFTDRVQGWIDENETKISDVEDSIDQIKDRIQTLRDKL